ncbi:MAG TPA: ABC transporter permease [Actinomycetota bacterium]|jgi:ribose transport system permease protein|nr:ABC transporter permease [Actinomycetota bacterium]
MSVDHVPAKDGTAEQQEPARGRARPMLTSQTLEALALPIAWVAVVIVFGFLKPDTFLTSANLSSILASQAVLVVVTLALIIPLTAGDYDLSVASVVGLSAMLVAILNVNLGWPVGWALLAALGAGLAVGLVNGAVVVLLQIDSLIVTLGMSTFVTGIVLWISGSNTVSGVSQNLVRPVIVWRLLSVPFEFYYALVVAVIVWYVFRYTPVGRRVLVVGRGREVARLSGIRVGAVRWAALGCSATIAALGGILYAGTSGAAGPSSGLELLLPAFAAAFLGATTIQPGRFNAWGTLIAVYFLVTGITGLQLMGAESYVQNLFYGAALILGVAFSQVVRRRRAARAGQPQRAT